MAICILWAVLAGVSTVIAVGSKSPWSAGVTVVMIGGVVIVAALYVVEEVKKLVKPEKPTDKSGKS